MAAAEEFPGPSGREVVNRSSFRELAPSVGHGNALPCVVWICELWRINHGLRRMDVFPE